MTAVDDSSKASGEVRFEQPSPDTLQLSFAGSWRLQDQRPGAAGCEEQFASSAGLRRVAFVTTQLGDWDSALVTYLARVVTLCRERNIEVDATGLPEGARRLLELAFAVPPKKDTGKHGEAAAHGHPHRYDGAGPVARHAGNDQFHRRGDPVAGSFPDAAGRSTGAPTCCW